MISDKIDKRHLPVRGAGRRGDPEMYGVPLADLRRKTKNLKILRFSLKQPEMTI